MARFRPEQPGVYRVERRGAARIRRRSAPRPRRLLVGGADLEMTDPRLNLQVLQRVALGSGGRVMPSQATARRSLDALRAARPAALIAVTRDLWHNGWSFGAIVVLLGAEWILRRRWGLR